ncbi:MAG: histidine kinase [Mesorhizobium sp.]
MPTLFRFLTIMTILAAVAFAGIFALATFVKPNVAEISERVPLKKLDER